MNRAVTQIHRRVGEFTATAGLACMLGLSACGGPEAGPEEQLRQWVSLAVEAAQTKSRRELIDMISPAYSDSRGSERDDIENMLRAYFFRQNSITLLANIDEIRVYGESAAEIELTVGMAGKNDGVFGFSADAYRFELELESDDGDWQLISARWGELGEEVH
jgi:hypothetical protein